MLREREKALDERKHYLLHQLQTLELEFRGTRTAERERLLEEREKVLDERENYVQHHLQNLDPGRQTEVWLDRITMCSRMSERSDLQDKAQ